MKQREEFEAWHAANYKQPLTKWSERYENSHVQGRWQGWIAARTTPAIQTESNDATFGAILFAFIRLSLVNPSEAQLHQLDRLIAFYGDQKIASQLKLLAYQARTPNINRDIGRRRLVFSGSSDFCGQASDAV